MHRLAIAILVALLTTTTAIVAVADTPPTQSEPPSGTLPDGCSGWSLADTRWVSSWRLPSTTFVQGVTIQKPLGVLHLFLARLLRCDT